MSWPSPTLCSNRKTGTKPPGNSRNPSIGTCWTTSLPRQRDINDVQHTKVMPSADCYTNHRFICSKVAFTFKPLLRKKGPQTRRLSVQKLRCPLHQKTYQTKLAERLDRVADPDTDIDQHWTQLKTVLQETTAEVAGFSSRKHKDWFDESGHRNPEATWDETFQPPTPHDKPWQQQLEGRVQNCL